MLDQLVSGLLSKSFAIARAIASLGISEGTLPIAATKAAA
jgi:hypothetical protein